MLAGDNPGKITDRTRVHSFKIGNDNLTIERLQALDQHRETIERFGLTGSEFTLITTGHGFDSLDAHQTLPDPALPNHVPGGHVVRDTVHPGSERTSVVEVREAAPELKVNLLRSRSRRTSASNS